MKWSATKFDREQLLAFIQAIDRNLPEETSVVLVGGSAAIIGYGSPVRTSDVDVFVGLTDGFVEAGLEAQKETGLAIGIEQSALTDIPYNYEDRVRAVKIPRLKRLTVIVPDKYDLVLSKTIRGYPHDLEAIEGIHKQHPLVLKTLVERFETELVGIVNSNPRILRQNVVAVVAALFGVSEARKLAESWGLPTPSTKSKK